MAEHGHLSSPFTIPLNKVDEVSAVPDVEVPLGPNDVRHALEFLQEAGLVKFKKASEGVRSCIKRGPVHQVTPECSYPSHGLGCCG